MRTSVRSLTGFPSSGSTCVNSVMGCAVDHAGSSSRPSMRTGWVSDRSVCYLASGRPVLMEETGVSDCLPSCSGLVTFSSFEEAVAMLEEVESHYDHHARAARSAAESIFATNVVLPGFLEAAAS